MDTLKSKLLVILVLLLVCIVGWFAYIYLGKGLNPFMKSEAEKQAYLKKVGDTLSVHSDKNFDASIAEFEKLLQNSPDTATSALIKEKLGVNLVAKGLRDGADSQDAVRGMDLLWSVALDQTLHDRVRANTFADIASIYMDMGSADFYIATAVYPPFNTLVTEASKSDPMTVQRAALKILQHSDEMYPNPYAKFGIVFQYVNLIGGNGLESGMNEKEASSLIQRYVVEGDAALVADSDYGEGTVALMMLNRAKGLALSNIFLKNKSSDEIEAAFKKAVGDGTNLNNKYVTDVQMEARFWYASYLLSTFGETRRADTDTLLQPYTPGITPADQYVKTRGMFVRWNQPPYQNFGQQRAMGLAKTSPAFASFLKSVGWTI